MSTQSTNQSPNEMPKDETLKELNRNAENLGTTEHDSDNDADDSDLDGDDEFDTEDEIFHEMEDDDGGLSPDAIAAFTNQLNAKSNITGKAANYRAGFVSLIGQPNAGKSTLLNKLLGDKVSIVSDKPQTTRTRVTGILNTKEAQIVFVDAPGVLKSTTGINKFLQAEATDVVINSDVICVLLAADSTEEHAKDLISMAKKTKLPWVAIVTKSDLLGGTRTPKFFNYFIEEKVPFISISTTKRGEEAKNEVLNKVIPLLPKSESPLYDEDLYTTQTVRQMAAEFVREACFENLHQEVPYGLAVRIAEFNEEDVVLKIRADLVIEKENHKAIVIGAKGQTIKKIGIEARKSIEGVVGRQVYLELHVQVKENWSQNPRLMKELGYVLPQD